MKKHENRPRRSVRRDRSTTHAIVLLEVLAMVAVGCIYDKSDRCGSERVLDNGLCVCPEGTKLINDACIEQTVKPSGLGDACKDNNGCMGNVFDRCEVPQDGMGYCTKNGCQNDSDCGGEYYCSHAEDPTFCKRSPTGQSESCQTQADCANYDANYCIPAGSMSACVVADCTSDADCSPGFSCQDFSAFLPGVPKICAPPQ